MKNVISPFPLLNLPDRIVKHVLQCMESVDLCVFLQTSNKTRPLISLLSNTLDPFPLKNLPDVVQNTVLKFMDLPAQNIYSQISNITRTQMISLNSKTIFPILRLPQTAVYLVLQCMKIMDKISFSHVSNRTKFLVSFKPFPFQRLPFAVLKNVLRIMDIPEQIAYSLVSNTTKAQVISLNLRIRVIAQIISEKILVYVYYGQINCMELAFFHEPSEITKSLGEVKSVLVRFGNEGENVTEVKMEWFKKGYHFKHFMLHLFAVLHEPKLYGTRFLNKTSFNLEDLKNELNEIGTSPTVFAPICSEEDSRILLKTLNPIDMCLLDDPSSMAFFEYAISHNFEQIYIPFANDVNLNHLLSTNSSKVEIYGSQLSLSRDLNVFLRQWVNGNNRRMKTLSIKHLADIFLDKRVILKNVKHTVGTSARQEGLFNVFTLHEQFEIRRRDGTATATIVLKSGAANAFDMYVWGD